MAEQYVTRHELRAALAEFHKDWAVIRAEWAEFRSEMRQEMADLRTEMRTGFAEIRTQFAEQRAAYASRETRVTRLMLTGGALGGLAGGLIAVAAKIFG